MVGRSQWNCKQHVVDNVKYRLLYTISFYHLAWNVTNDSKRFGNFMELIKYYDLMCRATVYQRVLVHLQNQVSDLHFWSCLLYTS